MSPSIHTILCLLKFICETVNAPFYLMSTRFPCPQVYLWFFYDLLRFWAFDTHLIHFNHCTFTISWLSTAIWLVSFDLIILSILSQTVADILIFSQIVSQPVLIPTSLPKFSRAANLSWIWIWYCSLHCTLFNFLRLDLTIWTLCIVCLLTAILSLILSPPDSGQCHNLMPWTIRHQVHMNAFSYLSKYGKFDCESFHQEMPK
jgi:hypothetical protein